MPHITIEIQKNTRENYTLPPLKFYTHLKQLYIAVLAVLFGLQLHAQTLLKKHVADFSVNHLSVPQALEKLSNETNVLFSYQSDIFKDAKSVNIDVKNETVEKVLAQMLHHSFLFTEENGYIVIRKAAFRIIEGIVLDDSTGEKIDNAFIYTMPATTKVQTNIDGKFIIKIPLDTTINYLCISKDFYTDKIISLENIDDEKQTISLRQMPVPELPPVTSETKNTYEKNVALHLFGGTSHGVNGLEAGTVFNYNKGNGSIIQIAGAVNIIEKSLNGVQLAGIHNYVGDTARGLQLAALLNKTEGEEDGVQIGAINHAKHLKGLQIGLINISDSSDGYSLGAINISGSKYFPAVSFFATDMMSTNAEIKLGNRKLYTSILAGANFFTKHIGYIGFGLGHDFVINQRMIFSTVFNWGMFWETRYLDGEKHGILHITKFDDNSISDINYLLEFRPSFSWRFAKRYSLFGGPVFKRYIDHFAGKTKYGIGWQLGISNDSWIKTTVRSSNSSDRSWSLQPALLPNFNTIGFRLLGYDVRVLKNLPDNMAFIATTGMAKLDNWYADYGINPNANSVPVFYQMAGLKIFATQHFFAAMQIGMSFKNHDIKERFLYAPEVGWDIGKRISLSMQYFKLEQDILSLRFGYTLWKSR
ncbi:hypothetical protein A9P82_13865 [Arachidicoccus ginsenosidimutans]|uniref:STN and carboxypeptidase regulatory-like domain-containing protein n=1 Tax=Arachidicoccus sp. BS20 TaxID=1850526 RepID=UPI0007F07F96|nr:STN and carboxypeptidase regulatory-like domain-containing protein [Arachidicoccus sp. BS20]ANI90283.1 hypothetical protein A9P82_13865 [Arachidicoccus sp. BS20]